MDLFPHALVRPTQHELMALVREALSTKKPLLLDAPTGIGKTAGVLAPALEFALEKGLTVFFLTSRQTQHRLVIETVRAMSERHSRRIVVADMISKRNMCAQDGVLNFHPGEFNDFCKRLRDGGQCEYFSNFGSINKPTPRANMLVKELAKRRPLHTEELVDISKRSALCPYEIAGQLGSQADVIVCDYSLIFNPSMRQSLLNRTKKQLDSSIVIIDEAHNLSARLRDMMSSKTSTIAIKRAQRESAKLEDDDLIDRINAILNGLEEMGQNMQYERLIRKDEFLDCVPGEVEEFIARLEKAAAIVHETQQHSFLQGLAEFIASWKKDEEGFIRVLAKQYIRKEWVLSLRLRALDPSQWTQPVISAARGTIMMSGTLSPTFMHRDIIGFPQDSIMRSFESPFPKTNRLSIIVPDVTTKFARRSPEEFAKMARICAEISNAVPGNVALFFPSYALRNEVHKIFHPLSKKRFFLEMQDFTKKDKAQFLEEFKAAYPNAVLLGVSGGNFSEGVDIENNILKAVIVIGLPLEHPDLETNALIRHYDIKFGKGWEYGYTLPALNRAVQSAGRCIRSEKDKGAIIFLDERYGWPNYRQYLPAGWDTQVVRDYSVRIKEFFKVS